METWLYDELLAIVLCFMNGSVSMMDDLTT